MAFGANLARLARFLTAGSNGDLTATNTPENSDVGDKKLSTTEYVAQMFAGSNRRLISSNGYQKLPGGLIIQWGTRAGINNTTGVNVTFPMAFPNTCLCVTATHVGVGTVPSQRIVEVIIRGPSYFDAYGNTTANAIQWMAIGY